MSEHLTRYIEDVRSAPAPLPEQAFVAGPVALLRSLEFLSDPERFANARVNAVSQVAARLIMTRVVGMMALDIDTLGSARFAIVSNPRQEVQGGIVVPRQLYRLNQQQPLEHLSIAAVIAEEIRVYKTGLYASGAVPDYSRFVNQRASCLEADALITMSDMIRSEDVAHNFTERQDDKILNYPNGLESLPSEYCFGNIPAAPMPDLDTVQTAVLGELELRGLTAPIGQVGSDILKIITSRTFEDLAAIEKALRTIGSPLFLRAVQPQALNESRAIDPVSGEEREFALSLGRVEPRLPNPNQAFTERDGVSYEENQERLSRTGFLHKA